ncbi:hypothetical protein, partial [Cognatiyoonia sp. IB215182]|uniref:hypothetical protein n=1 Tax=Cognatiyoonia sp. IB215182 TaxID=3097353 RepID=UPI002A24EE0A
MQGYAHGHGWGVADYPDGVPMVEKQVWAAFHGEYFSRKAARVADVAGQDSAKRKVSELVDFLRDPESFSRVPDQSTQGRTVAFSDERVPITEFPLLLLNKGCDRRRCRLRPLFHLGPKRWDNASTCHVNDTYKQRRIVQRGLPEQCVERLALAAIGHTGLVEHRMPWRGEGLCVYAVLLLRTGSNLWFVS